MLMSLLTNIDSSIGLQMPILYHFFLLHRHTFYCYCRDRYSIIVEKLFELLNNAIAKLLLKRVMVCNN